MTNWLLIVQWTCIVIQVVAAGFLLWTIHRSRKLAREEHRLYDQAGEMWQLAGKTLGIAAALGRHLSACPLCPTNPCPIGLELRFEIGEATRAAEAAMVLVKNA